MNPARSWISRVRSRMGSPANWASGQLMRRATSTSMRRFQGLRCDRTPRSGCCSLGRRGRPSRPTRGGSGLTNRPSPWRARCSSCRDYSVVVSLDQPQMILIAGPYRSGTNDEPARMAQNVESMEAFALAIFRAGHIPVVGEWLALPLVRLAGSTTVGTAAFTEVFHPIAVRLLDKCDAVLRVGGPSAGADEMVRVGAEKGLKIYRALDAIPAASP